MTNAVYQIHDKGFIRHQENELCPKTANAASSKMKNWLPHIQTENAKARKDRQEKVPYLLFPLALLRCGHNWSSSPCCSLSHTSETVLQYILSNHFWVRVHLITATGFSSLAFRNMNKYLTSHTPLSMKGNIGCEWGEIQSTQSLIWLLLAQVWTSPWAVTHWWSTRSVTFGGLNKRFTLMFSFEHSNDKSCLFPLNMPSEILFLCPHTQG